MGDKIANFRASGIVLVEKYRFIIFVTVRSNTVKQPLKTAAGRGSSSQHFDNGFLENVFNSTWVTSAKLKILHCKLSHLEEKTQHVLSFQQARVFLSEEGGAT